VRASCGDGKRFGVEIRYVHNPDVDRGLATALFAIEPEVRERFAFLLGDELYLGTNHARLTDCADALAVCAILPTEDADVIRKNYGVALDDGRITALVEKPDAPLGPYAGVGTFLFDPAIFAHARATAPSARSGRVELIDVLDRAAHAGELVLPSRSKAST
jgi:glucose-1-phosphate thymidylyltransferase